MIESIVIDYLEQYVPAYGEEPEKFPADGRCVIVEKTGGGAEAPGIRKATLAVQCYGNTLAEAAQLSEDVIGYMEAFATLPEVSRCEVNSSYNRTDDRKKRYRYQAVFVITYY